jgi:TIR domain
MPQNTRYGPKQALLPASRGVGTLTTYAYSYGKQSPRVTFFAWGVGSSLAIAVTTAATWSGLATWLAGAGIPAWCDHEIATGERWEQVIQEQILGCDAMLVVMTPGADKSLWVKREIIFAENNGKGVLPLLLAGQPFFRLAEVHYENVTGKRMPSAAFAASVRRLIDQTYRERTAEITAANVGALVMVPAEHERLLRQFDLVERWARAHLAEALEAVKTLPHGRMRDVLFDLLVGGLRRTGKNAMGLPTAKEPVASQWCIDLASLLRRYVERKGRLSVETFVKTLRGSVLKSGADFYAARELWSRLGYEPRDDDYVIRCILDEIARTDRVSAEARDALVGMRQPIQQLVDVARERPGVAPGIPPMSPGTTVELLLVSVGADRYTHEARRLGTCPWVQTYCWVDTTNASKPDQLIGLVSPDVDMILEGRAVTLG